MGTRVTQAQWDAKRAEAKAKAREALLQDAGDEEVTVPEEPEGDLKAYADMSDEELYQEVSTRGIDISEMTDKDEVIAALEAADESADE